VIVSRYTTRAVHHVSRPADLADDLVFENPPSKTATARMIFPILLRFDGKDLFSLP